MIEGHGDDSYRYKHPIVSNFSSNVYGRADLSGLKEYLSRHLDCISSYPEPEAESLRKALAEYHWIHEDEISVTNGATEAIYLIAQTFAGSHSVVMSPTFSEYADACRIHRHKVRHAYTLDSFSEETQIVWICNPNNPTGYLYTRAEMNKIRDLVKKYDLYLFSDEVYREFCYTGAPYISAFHLDGIEENVVLIDSVSKRYSMTGVRIGALVTKNKEVRKNVIKFCQARLSPPLLGQIASEAAMNTSSEYMLEMYNEYVERRKFLIDGLNRIPGVYSPIPMGAFYTVARLPIDDADKFCAWLLSDFEYEGQTVMMAPASGFYTIDGYGKDEVRIAYVLDKEDLKKSLIVLQKALEVYPGKTL